MHRRTLLGGFAASMIMGTRGYALTCTALQPDWEFVADTVMGGVSTGQITTVEHAGRTAMRLSGTVSLDNNGGFIQMAFNPASGSGAFDASGFTGISFEVLGNGAPYALNLRTTDLARPWQSYRAPFAATDEWQRVTIPFDAFTPSNTDVPLNPARIRRIGIIAVGQAVEVDVTVANICFSR